MRHSRAARASKPPPECASSGREGRGLKRHSGSPRPERPVPAPVHRRAEKQRSGSAEGNAMEMCHVEEHMEMCHTRVTRACAPRHV